MKFGSWPLIGLCETVSIADYAIRLLLLSKGASCGWTLMKVVDFCLNFSEVLATTLGNAFWRFIQWGLKLLVSAFLNLVCNDKTGWAFCQDFKILLDFRYKLWHKSCREIKAFFRRWGSNPRHGDFLRFSPCPCSNRTRNVL